MTDGSGEVPMGSLVDPKTKRVRGSYFVHILPKCIHIWCSHQVKHLTPEDAERIKASPIAQQ